MCYNDFKPKNKSNPDQMTKQKKKLKIIKSQFFIFNRLE